MTGLPAQPTASVQPAVPAQFQTFLAFDFGLKRTGVASGNRMLRTASPQATIKAEGDAVMERFAQAKRDGAEPGSEQADAAVQAHRDHIETWFNDVPLPMLRGMGEMFSADPRFAKTYDDVEPDLAPYVTSVITAYCAKRGVDENCGS